MLIRFSASANKAVSGVQVGVQEIAAATIAVLKISFTG
jgi:hypothetical protein